jgi:hypothetical protein
MNAGSALRVQYDEPQWTSSSAIRFSQARSETIRVPRPQVSTPSTATEPDWIRPTADRISDLVALGHDWDSRGSSEVRLDAIVFALHVLGQVMPPTAPAPSIIPLGDGSIQLIWTNPAADLEVEVIGANDAVVYHLNKATGDEQETRMATDLSLLTNLLWADFKG